MKNKKILLISPHADDIEFWASGFIIKYPNNKCKHICFSLCPKAIPKGYTKKDAFREWSKAQKVMGIEDPQVSNYPERDYPRFREDILQYLYDLNKSYKPDIVITSCPEDLHQDHQTVANESLRAFNQSTILQYVGRRSIQHNVFNYHVVLDEKQRKKKLKIIKMFKSQLSVQPYLAIISRRLRQHGEDIGVKYAESFILRQYIDR